MQTWRLVIEYDGRRFCGFQRQAGDRTVQETLEDALAKLFGGERIVVHGAGRTDSGVHALGQVVSFRAQTERDPRKVRLGLNTLLPEDVACVEAGPAPEGFHPRTWAVRKLYRYDILARPDRSPFLVGRAWHIRHAVDWEAVDAALALYRGTHDFSGFRGAGCAIPKTVRTIERVERRREGDLHHLEFEAKGFLRYQVRIMVGTAVDVGMGRRTLAQVEEALRGGDRGVAGRTAPPDGLTLVRVEMRDS